MAPSWCDRQPPTVWWPLLLLLWKYSMNTSMRAVRVQCRATVLQKHAQAKPMQSGVFNEYFAASRWLLDWVVSWWSVAPPRFYCEPGSKNDLVNGLGGVSGWLNWLCSTLSWMAKYTSCFRLRRKNVDICLTKFDFKATKSLTHLTRLWAPFVGLVHMHVHVKFLQNT